MVPASTPARLSSRALGDDAEGPPEAVLRVDVDREHPSPVASTAARFAAVDVLPTPPLDEHTASRMGAASQDGGGRAR